MSTEYSTGQKLGDYEILGVLGAGGMGKVYKVRNSISDRVEAMKILLPDLAGQKELADRFLREIKVLASLNHPNIAALRTALTLDNQLVMIMEFVDGVTLSSRIQQGPLPPTLAVKYIDQVLDALSYAHKQNIIHRDIKPANMMLTSDGAVKLMDFGIARSSTDRSLTMTGTTLGSLNYMPPEQVKGDPADNRSDLYSLGVSLYELVTGQLPFQAESNYAMMAAHLQEAPKPPIVLRPGIPQPLNQIILMAMAKDPNERFQSADAFRGALKSVLSQGGGTQPAVAPHAYAPAAGVGGATALFQETPASQSPTTLVDRPVFQQTQAIAATAPVPADAPPPPPSMARAVSHRGLYITLGALIVVGVLFAGGLYLPRHMKIFADKSAEQAKPAATDTSAPAAASAPAADSAAAPQASPAPAASTPADTSASQPASSPSSTSTPQVQAPSSAQPESSAPSVAAPDAPAPPSAPAPAPKKAARRARSSANTQPASQQATAQQASVDQVPSADAALVQENEQRFDDMDSRTSAVSQSLDNLQRQQAAAGYGLRGDIVAAQSRLKTDLAKAQAATQKNDAKTAKKYLDMAEAELQTIEKFLGH
ncbi:MAG TPA: serine/threonine-protein kinase [Candidatus Acidoferrum sp.]|nr:serine/threonine-protein kinase [Candidatus Acidoferrum sp.]